MPNSTLLTIPQAAEAVSQACGVFVPDWKVRRVVDALGTEVHRAGLYRLVPRSMIGDIIKELRRQGWLQTPEAAAR